MDFTKIKEARQVGYSDKEILDHFASSDPRVQTAREAGYSDKEILGHIAPAPSPGVAAGALAGTAGGYLGTQAARTVGGMASLPGTIAKGADWLYSQAGIDPASIFGQQGAKVLNTMATDYPSADKISDTALDTVGMKPVNLEGNIPGGKILDTGVQGLMGSLMTGGTSLPSMLAGAFGGAGSEAAGQFAEGTPYEVPARLAGAVVGGVGGAVAPSVARMGYDVAKAPFAPFTAGGREKIAADSLRSAAADPEAAIAGLDTYTIGREAFPDSVPGFKIDAGKASRDPGLMRVAESAAPARPGMGAQFQENNRLATQVLDDITTGLPANPGDVIQSTLADRAAALAKARKTATDPLYTAARNSTVKVDPTEAWATAAKRAEETLLEPQKLMKTTQGLLEGPNASTPRGLMAVREAIGNLQDDASLGNYSKGLLKTIKGKVDDALAAVPEEQLARTKFAEMSIPLEPFADKTIASVLDKGKYNKGLTMPAEAVASKFIKGGDLSGPTVQKLMMAAGGDPRVRQAMQSAYISDFKKVAASNTAEDVAGNAMLGANPAAKWMEAHRGGAANVLTDSQLKALDDITRHLKDQAQTIPGRTGSQTFDRLASESILGAIVSKRFADASILHPIQKGLGLVYGGADKKVVDVIFDAIQDPRVAAALMKKATPGNVKMAEPLLQSIGRGTAYPALTSGERGSP